MRYLEIIARMYVKANEKIVNTTEKCFRENETLFFFFLIRNLKHYATM